MALAERTWQSQEFGLVSWGSPDSLHSYLGTDLAQWALLAGHGDWAQTYLRDLLHHSSSTLGQAELFSAARHGFGNNLPPHTTAAADVVDLIRNMFVQDDGDTIEVAMGAPEAWWQGARFGPAPTRFGSITIELEHSGRDSWRARWSPVSSFVRVWVPPGHHILSAGDRAGITSRRTVVLPSGESQVTLRVQAESR
jgi:hypothetical protein